MSVPMITRAEMLRWSPKALAPLVDALIEGEAYLSEAGILDSRLTLSHFMAQVGAETAGLTLMRESLTFKSVASVRKTWPARAGKHSDEWIAQNLVKSPQSLGGWAYGGRMGNKAFPSRDGYDFRGGGYIQITGRSNVTTYAKKLGYPPPYEGLLDDPVFCLRAACAMWRDKKCNVYASQNDLLSVSRIINVGSARSTVMPNGMDHRREWLRKSWAIWGDERRPMIPDVAELTERDLRERGSTTIASGDLIKIGGAAGAGLSAATGAAKETGAIDVAVPVVADDPISKLKELTSDTDVVTTAIGAFKGFFELALSNLWVLGLSLGIACWIIARRINLRRLIDARLGLHTGRIAD